MVLPADQGRPGRRVRQAGRGQDLTTTIIRHHRKGVRGRRRHLARIRDRTESILFWTRKDRLALEHYGARTLRDLRELIPQTLAHPHRRDLPSTTNSDDPSRALVSSRKHTTYVSLNLSAETQR
jgi:hypothetical protein